MRAGTRLNLRCAQCGRAFKNAGNLQKHLNGHREGREWNARPWKAAK